MPNGDEIDDTEEASVDDDSPHPRNRQRLLKRGFKENKL
jgi:hypothetical protein